MIHLKDFDDRINNCVDKIISYLSNISIITWDEFISKKFDRNEVDRLIDTTAKDMNEVHEIKFFMKLKLCNKKQLSNMLNRYLQLEDYSKCILLRDRISTLN